MGNKSPQTKSRQRANSKARFNVRYDKTHDRFYIRVPDDLRPLYSQGIFSDFEDEADAKAFAEAENLKYETEITPKELTSALSYLELCQNEFGYDGNLKQLAKEKYEALKRQSKEAQEAQDKSKDEPTLEEIRNIWFSELTAST